MGTVFSQLGRTTAQQNQMVADFCNELIELMLDRNTILQVTSSTLPYDANTMTVAIPTDMRQLDIIKITQQNTGTDPVHDLQPIDFLNPSGVESLPLTVQSGYQTWEFPEIGFGWDDTKTSIKLYQEPSSAGNIVMHYRARPTAITATMVANALPTATVPIDTTVDLPKICLRALAMGLGVKYCEIAKPQAADYLRYKWDNPDYGMPGVPTEPGEMQKLAFRFINILAAYNTHPSQNYPTNWLDRVTNVDQFDNTLGNGTYPV